MQKDSMFAPLSCIVSHIVSHIGNKRIDIRAQDEDKNTTRRISSNILVLLLPLTNRVMTGSKEITIVVVVLFHFISWNMSIIRAQQQQQKNKQKNKKQTKEGRKNGIIE